MSEKINQLLNTIVPGDIVIQSWLSRQGISPQLAGKYCESKWLVRLGVGAYFRAGKQPSWKQAVQCLQYQQNENIHIAGLSSLALQGKAHYIQMGENSIWLNIRTNSVLPKWFMDFPKMELAEALTNWHILRTTKLSAVKDEDLIDLKAMGFN